MKIRIVTAVIGLILFIPIVIFGGLFFNIVAYILASVALFELTRMYDMKKRRYYLALASLFLWLLLLPSDLIGLLFNRYEKFDFIAMFIVFVLILTVLSKNTFTFEQAGFLLLSALYVGIGFSFLMDLRDAGLNYLLFVLFTIWATDTGAYFLGKAFGKRKLWPAISPNKTIGGAIGGIVMAVIVGVVFQLVYPFHFSIILVIILSIVISIVGQLGDLVASAFKRHFKVKDAGALFPGHGGVLDRFDSLLFVLIVLSFIRMI